MPNEVGSSLVIRVGSRVDSWAKRNPMNTVSAGVAIVALMVAGCSRTPKASFPRAPIVLVSLDTVRMDEVAGFGADQKRTPVLAALGEESVRFKNAIAVSHHTAPSHATILTGFSPMVHGVAPGVDGSGSFALPKEIPTIAEILRAAGYRTGGFTDGVQLIPKRGFARGFEVYKHDFSHLAGKTSRIEQFLDAVGDEPFFLFAHTYRAHRPYRAEPDRLAELLAGYDGVFAAPTRELAGVPINQGDRVYELMQQLDINERTAPEDVAFIKSLYRAGVEATDADLGTLVDLLKRRGIWDRAIVVVTSDHGEAFLEHPHATVHKHLWDEVVRVPLLIKLPGGERGDPEVEEVVGSSRLMPTLLELVGVTPPVPTEGTSFADSLTGMAPLREQPVFSAMYCGERVEPVVLATRTRFFKLLEAQVPQDELPRWARQPHSSAFFDLENDPGEKRDLIESGHSEIARLRKARVQAAENWARLRSQLGIEGAEVTELDPAELEAMRGIGYLGGD